MAPPPESLGRPEATVQRPEAPPPEAPPLIQTADGVQSGRATVRGVCTALFVFDIAMAVDLDVAERLVAGLVGQASPPSPATPGAGAGSGDAGAAGGGGGGAGGAGGAGGVGAKQRETFRHDRKAPAYFDYKPAPIRVTLPARPVAIAEGFTTEPLIDLLITDFGAACVSYRIPLDGPLERLVELSERLFDSAVLRDGARARSEEIGRTLAPALHKAGPTPQVEDYLIFEIRSVEVDGRARPPNALLETDATTLAQILRSERAPMSNEEIADALSCRVSYGREDAALIDWNAAVLLDREADDVRAVLEFANIELLEMRFLDDRLDDVLDAAYLAMQRFKAGWRSLIPSGLRPMRRIAQLQVDSAVLFEGVNNALKLIGDQYLARVYRLAAQRFHLPERDLTIERKLRAIEGIYEKMTDRESNRRMELLEWIIILLIAFEIVWGFLTLH